LEQSREVRNSYLLEISLDLFSIVFLLLEKVLHEVGPKEIKTQIATEE
jgi:hypothetical protein